MGACPEDRIRWVDHRENENNIEDDLGSLFGSDDILDDAPSNDAASEASTVSTKISVPDSEKEYGPYKDHLPSMETLRAYEDIWEDDDEVEEERPHVNNFFRCLGYRLGSTLSQLAGLTQEIEEQLTPKQQKLNKKFVEEVFSYWKGDAFRRPNDPSINKTLKDDSPAVTPMYREVIKQAEPERFDPKWGKWHIDDDFKEETAEIVRQEVLKELNRNQSLLFPTRTVTYMSENDEKLEITRRDPVWSFAHPDHRRKAKRFWDINRWPMHLQSEATQKAIKASGPTKQPQTKTASQEVPPSTQEAPGPKAPAVTVEEPPVEEPSIVRGYSVPYSNEYNRRRFTSDVTEFWAGDTPYQRKAIEDHLRSRKYLQSSERTCTNRSRFGNH